VQIYSRASQECQQLFCVAQRSRTAVRLSTFLEFAVDSRGTAEEG